MSDSISALGAQLASAEAHVAELKARIMGAAPSAPAPDPEAPLKLDLGCGERKREGFTGVDSENFKGVDIIWNLNAKWPWSDSSVDEVHCSHMFEHVPAARRWHFMNELWRVLKPGAKAQFITPHWASERAVGDPTHEWPPIAPFSLLYFDKQWRAVNAPHNKSFTCDFTNTAAIEPNPEMAMGRVQEYVANAVKTQINGGHDLHWTLTKRVT